MAPAKASALSNNPADKLFACLNYPVIKASTDYVSAPFYFDACRAWYDRLSREHRGIVALVISVYTDGDEIVAERLAVFPTADHPVAFNLDDARRDELPCGHFRFPRVVDLGLPQANS